jgi:hypothetical protein
VHVLDLHADGAILPHLDSLEFVGSYIAGLSLCSAAIMRLTHVDDSSARIDLLLPPRSLYVLRLPKFIFFSLCVLFAYRRTQLFFVCFVLQRGWPVQVQARSAGWHATLWKWKPHRRPGQAHFTAVSRAFGRSYTLRCTPLVHDKIIKIEKGKKSRPELLTQPKRETNGIFTGNGRHFIDTPRESCCSLSGFWR